MTATLRPGGQLASTVCTTRVVVVRAPAEGVQEITCGGSPMVAAPPGKPDSKPDGDVITLLGKRYVDADGSIEVLCTSPGTGELSYGGTPMTIKAAKALPASD
ncbi:hypothetical protein [Rhodococcus artemisiae]|uniref:PAAR motif-containing protein n=1 Tax=Rhodococcus artemisiae TaxID=714159 RepID=A0ABU7L5P4_9NOCA|nr:hypothetical protein [Rhodococcus artemisiae]MEE2056871.1 hypothetical protein [Rhodococcus artemisiae]